jgi:hypothetical protein
MRSAYLCAGPRARLESSDGSCSDRLLESLPGLCLGRTRPGHWMAISVICASWISFGTLRLATATDDGSPRGSGCVNDNVDPTMPSFSIPGRKVDAAHQALAGEEDSDGDEDSSESGKTTVEPTGDPDTDYVNSKLRSFLSPSEIEFLGDGRVRLAFDFKEKDESHEKIFSVPIREGMKEAFRWTIEDEEFVIGGTQGIRLSDKGIAFLRVWFRDDVQAEMSYRQYINHSDRLIAAIVFGTTKRAVGSNFGSQTIHVSSGGVGKLKGKTEAVSFNQEASFRLVVKNGTFESYRKKIKKSADKYPTKTLASGQIGILWGGSISAIVPNFEVTGTLDMAKTAAEIRKALGDKKPKASAGTTTKSKKPAGGSTRGGSKKDDEGSDAGGTDGESKKDDSRS